MGIRKYAQVSQGPSSCGLERMLEIAHLFSSLRFSSESDELHASLSPCHWEQGREGWEYPWEVEVRLFLKWPFQNFYKRFLEVLFKTKGLGLCY